MSIDIMRFPLMRSVFADKPDPEPAPPAGQPEVTTSQPSRQETTMSSTGTAAAPAPAETPTSLGSIIHTIWTKAETDFTVAENWIDGAVAKVEAVLPGAAREVEALKQDASDAIGVVADDAVSFEPAFVTVLETGADAAISTVAGPYAQPLNQIANKAIQSIVDTGTAALKAWALKVQAQYAENTAADGGGK